LIALTHTEQQHFNFEYLIFNTGKQCRYFYLKISSLKNKGQGHGKNETVPAWSVIFISVDIGNRWFCTGKV